MLRNIHGRQAWRGVTLLLRFHFVEEEIGEMNAEKRRPAGLLQAFRITSNGSRLLDFDVGEFAARILLPAVNDEAAAGEVAFLVIGQIAHDGLELLARRNLRGDL